MKKSLVIGLLLIGIILYVCFVWFTKSTNIPNTTTDTNFDISDATTTPASIEEAGANPTETQPPALENESVIIDTTTLSDGQRGVLETFGVEGETIEITPAMLECAKEKIGQERLDAIIAGDTPGFFEGVQLASCY